MIGGQKIRFITLSLFPSAKTASSVPSSAHSFSLFLSHFSLMMSSYIKTERGQKDGWREGKKQRYKVGKEELSAMHETVITFTAVNVVHNLFY